MKLYDDYLAAPAEKRAFASKAILSEVAAAANLTAYLARVTEGVTYITDPAEAMDFAQSVAGLTVYPSALGMDLETMPHPEWVGHPGAGLVPALSLIRLWSIYDPATLRVAVIDVQAAGLEWVRLFKEWNTPTVWHNAAFDLAHIWHHLKQELSFDCTMLLDRVLTEENRGLRVLAEELEGITISKALQVSDWSRPSLHVEQIDYAAADAVIAGRVLQKLRQAAQEADEMRAYSLLAETVYPVIRQAPIKLDLEAHSAWVDRLEVTISEKAAALAAAGLVNRGSVKAKQRFLTDRLDGLDLIDWPMTEAGQLSTQRGHLIAAAHIPGLKDLADCTEAEHLNATFGAGLRDKLAGDRLYPSFLIGGAATGRFTSNSPNLQNLPRRDFRSFITAGEGRAFVVADYSQIELRVAAELIGETVMQDAFAEGKDLHQMVGDAALDLIGPAMAKPRPLGKVVNFGLLYGGGAAMLVQFAKGTYAVQITLQQAQQLKDLFRHSYPAVADWQERQPREAQAWGYAQTLHAGLKVSMGATDYTRALNVPVQGTAAEILMLALQEVDAKLHGFGWAGSGWQVSHHVHDEIVLVGPEETAEQAARLLEGCMATAFMTVLPNASTRGIVEAGIGRTWADAKP